MGFAITTKRMRLRPFTGEDVDHLTGISGFWHFHEPPPLELIFRFRV